ncbi:hypothetical protein NL676_004596 [Syzygium grande]|nr:hypothetical protein NL676_004596 [Syzygium grande]
MRLGGSIPAEEKTKAVKISSWGGGARGNWGMRARNLGGVPSGRRFRLFRDETLRGKVFLRMRMTTTAADADGGVEGEGKNDDEVT